MGVSPHTMHSAWPLVGRLLELSVLRDSETSTIVVGEAGVGKTRLLREAAEAAGQRGASVVDVVGSAALQPIALGAFASAIRLDPDGLDSRDRLLRSAIEHFRALPSPLLLVVDDAHLLDDLSAALVAQIGRSGVRVIASLRSGMECPTDITALWSSGPATRLDLAPFDAADLAAVLSSGLGGDIDLVTRERVWRLTGGNVLFAREIVLQGLATGALVEQDGTWHWQGPLEASPRLNDVIAERLRATSAEAREVLEVLAVTGPVGLAEIELATSTAGVAAAERAGLVTLVRSGRRATLHPTHPLYVEVARAQLGALGRAALGARVGRVLLETGSQRRDDPMRIATAFLAADEPAAPVELVLHAAARFRSAGDLEQARRLGDYAVRIRPSAGALLSLAETEYWRGDRQRVLEIVRGVDLDDLDPDEVLLATMLASSSHFWTYGDLEEMDRWLEQGIRRLDEARARELRAHRVEMLMFAGRTEEAVDEGRRLLGASEPRTRLRALSGLLPALAVRGRLEDAEELLPSALELVEQFAESMVNVSGGVMVGAFVTSMYGGSLPTIDPVLDALRLEWAQRADDPFEGVWAFLLGRSMLAQGRLDLARPLLADANAVLAAGDPGQVRPWCLAALCQARAMSGDGVGAARALAALEDMWSPSHEILRFEVGLARAWTAAAGGETTTAAAVAHQLGCALLDRGELVTAANALHDAMRLGARPSDVSPILERAAAHCDGPVVAALALHARGAATHDVGLMASAAEKLEGAGWLLHACEVFSQVARASGDAGWAESRGTAAAACCSLRSRCRGAVTPELLRSLESTEAAVLTAREREVALMAARGASKREIAERLGLSIRTVGNHINHVYGKLGITSREQLRCTLGVYPDSAGCFSG